MTPRNSSDNPHDRLPPVVFAVLKGYPENISIKTRLESDILVVMSADLVLEFLNPVASEFFLLIDGKLSLFQIVEELSRRYDADFLTIAEDIIELVRSFQRKRILRLNSNPIC